MNVAVASWGWRLRRVTGRDILLLAEAQLVLLRCQAAKWRRPVGQLIEWNAAEPPGAGAAMDGRTRDSAVAVAWAVTRAARYGVFRPQCLVRSLAIQRMLRSRGVDTGRLNIGVRMQDGSFQAHAWVELNGAVIGDTLKHVQTFTKVTDFRLVEL